MTEKVSGKVPVTFAKGLLDDVAELTATTNEDDQGELVPPVPGRGLFAQRPGRFGLSVASEARGLGGANLSN